MWIHLVPTWSGRKAIQARIIHKCSRLTELMELSQVELHDHVVVDPMTDVVAEERTQPIRVGVVDRDD